MPKHRRRRAGRPRKDGARRRKTTAAERRPETDLGSNELRVRKLRLANGGDTPVEIIDPGAILHAHGLIEAKDLAVLRLLAGWLHQVRVAFQLPAGSPNGLWAAITSGSGAGQWAPAGSIGGGDRALFRLTELHQHFAEIGALDQLALTLRVAAGESHPATAVELRELRGGLATIAHLQRHGRRRSPAHLAAQ